MKEIALHIMDLVQNSIRAKASEIEISISESVKNNFLKIDINDNGSGMAPEVVQKVTDPFYTSRTTRKVGLGIPLFKHLVEQCNGRFAIKSKKGKGTQISSSMELNNIDRQPMGDIAGVMVLIISANPIIRFLYIHRTDVGNYNMDTDEIKEALGINGSYEPGILKYLKEMIKENLKEIETSN
jgi:anti-sigma regulatory factor (Ser/Thr protein kinase)